MARHQTPPTSPNRLASERPTHCPRYTRFLHALTRANFRNNDMKLPYSSENKHQDGEGDLKSFISVCISQSARLSQPDISSPKRRRHHQHTALAPHETDPSRNYAEMDRREKSAEQWRFPGRTCLRSCRRWVFTVPCLSNPRRRTWNARRQRYRSHSGTRGRVESRAYVAAPLSRLKRTNWAIHLYGFHVDECMQA